MKGSKGSKQTHCLSISRQMFTLYPFHIHFIILKSRQHLCKRPFGDHYLWRWPKAPLCMCVLWQCEPNSSQGNFLSAKKHCSVANQQLSAKEEVETKRSDLAQVTGNCKVNGGNVWIFIFLVLYLVFFFCAFLVIFALGKRDQDTLHW